MSTLDEVRGDVRNTEEADGLHGYAKSYDEWFSKFKCDDAEKAVAIIYKKCKQHVEKEDCGYTKEDWEDALELTAEAILEPFNWKKFSNQEKAMVFTCVTLASKELTAAGDVEIAQMLHSESAYLEKRKKRTDGKKQK